jgi:peroxiredoxin
LNFNTRLETEPEPEHQHQPETDQKSKRPSACVHPGMRATQQFSGTLQLFSVPEAIQFISGGAKSGTLRFSTPNPDLELRLHLKAGRIVGLSGRSVPRLSDVLLRQGIPPEVVGRLGMEMSQNKNPDALKSLLRSTLESALERRLMIGLLPIWEEREGSFEFAPSDNPPVTLEPGLAFENVALEVARRVDEFSRSMLNIAPADVYAIAERIGDFSERIAHLTAQDWALVNLIDGEQSLAQVGWQAVLCFDEVAGAVSALEAAGLIELRSAQRGLQIKYSRLQPGDLAPAFTLPSMDGGHFSLGALRGKRTLLAFHRHAGCPYCNLRMHELIQAHPQLTMAGVQVVAVFGSSVQGLRERVGLQQPPFTLVADEDDAIHTLYGTQRSLLGSLSPALLPKWLEGYRLASKHGIKHGSTDNQATRMPADFLIGPDLRLEGVLYGSNATEHMSIPALERWGIEGAFAS